MAIMLFNPTKCEMICISNKKHPVVEDYYIQNHLSKAVTCVKYSGVTIDKCNPVMNMLTEFPTKLTQQMHFTEHQALSTKS